jgi:hypothetical protein
VDLDRDRLNAAIDTIVSASIEMSSHCSGEEGWNYARIAKGVYDVMAREGLTRVDAFMVLGIVMGILRDRVDRQFGHGHFHGPGSDGIN